MKKIKPHTGGKYLDKVQQRKNKSWSNWVPVLPKILNGLEEWFWAGDVTQVVECLPHKFKALSSIPNVCKNK
jgi:hypothetical protein